MGPVYIKYLIEINPLPFQHYKMQSVSFIILNYLTLTVLITSSKIMLIVMIILLE